MTVKVSKALPGLLCGPEELLASAAFSPLAIQTGETTQAVCWKWSLARARSEAVPGPCLGEHQLGRALDSADEPAVELGIRSWYHLLSRCFYIQEHFSGVT